MEGNSSSQPPGANQKNTEWESQCRRGGCSALHGTKSTARFISRAPVAAAAAALLGEETGRREPAPEWKAPPPPLAAAPSSWYEMTTTSAAGSGDFGLGLVLLLRRRVPCRREELLARGVRQRDRWTPQGRTLMGLLADETSTVGGSSTGAPACSPRGLGTDQSTSVCWERSWGTRGSCTPGIVSKVMEVRGSS